MDCVSFWCRFLMFWFLIVENSIAKILKHILPASHHRFTDLYLYCCCCQFFKNFAKPAFKLSCLIIDVLNFQKPFPLGFVLVTVIVRIRPLWSRKYRYIFELLIFIYINSIHSAMYRIVTVMKCVLFFAWVLFPQLSNKLCLF